MREVCVEDIERVHGGIAPAVVPLAQTVVTWTAKTVIAAIGAYSTTEGLEKMYEDKEAQREHEEKWRKQSERRTSGNPSLLENLITISS